MKYIFVFFITMNTLFALYLSDELPAESVQLIESFDCFSEEEKQVMYTYILALRYRMDNVDNRDALVKTELDYWRLWHLVSDIEHECKLNYKFGDIIEETLLPDQKSRDILSKLRRVESGIRVDGTSESSERMRKYDAELRERILKNPPKYRVVDKNPEMRDYNLKVLKQYEPNTIPQNVYDWIGEQNVSGVKKDLLLRHAYLNEEMIRSYDKPEQRHKIKQELLYLSECQNYHDIHLGGEYYHNFRRRLAGQSGRYNFYHPLKTDFLPKELEIYCEHNITKTVLGTFEPVKEKEPKKKERNIAFEESRKFIAGYKGDEQMKKRMNSYLTLVTQLMRGQGKDLNGGLQAARLGSCFQGKDAEFMATLFNDVTQSGLKEEFTKKVLEPQLWWVMTIKMKMDAEGESDELKHFFDCNQTSMGIKPVQAMRSTEPKETSGFTANDMRKASSQISEIFKNYAGVFENRPTPDLDNEKAIDAGIVPKKMVDEKGQIKVYLGESFTIKGMPDGGVGLILSGIPGGKLCSDLVMFANSGNDTIFYNSKSYDGIDYVLVDGKKVKTDYYVGAHVNRLCSTEGNKTVSIVKENTLIEHKYQAKQLDSAFSVTKKVKTFDRNRYSPDGGAKFNNKSAFVWSGNKAKIFDFEQRVGYASIKMLPKEFTSSFHMTFSFDDKYLALQRYGNTIYLWNSNEGKLVNTLKLEKEEAGTLEMFMPDNKTLVLSGEKVRLYDSEKLRVSAEFEPKFMQTGRSFSRVRITAISLSPDGTTLYVGSNKNIVERWSIENGQPRYVDQILDKEIREIGAMTFDEKNTNILVIGGVGNKVNFWDTEKKKVINSYTADERMNCRNIRFSDDGKYMMAVGEHGAFLWQIGNETQLEIVKGDKIAGAMFLPDSTGFVTMGKDVDVWQINEQ